MKQKICSQMYLQILCTHDNFLFRFETVKLKPTINYFIWYYKYMKVGWISTLTRPETGRIYNFLKGLLKTRESLILMLYCIEGTY